VFGNGLMGVEHQQMRSGGIPTNPMMLTQDKIAECFGTVGATTRWTIIGVPECRCMRQSVKYDCGIEKELSH